MAASPESPISPFWTLETSSPVFFRYWTGLDQWQIAAAENDPLIITALNLFNAKIVE